MAIARYWQRRSEDLLITRGWFDPLASMAAIDNAELKSVASEVREMMKKVVENI